MSTLKYDTEEKREALARIHYPHNEFGVAGHMRSTEEHAMPLEARNLALEAALKMAEGALKEAHEEAQMSGKHFSFANHDRLNAKALVERLNAAIIAIKQLDQ